ncbi:DUF4386 domain-containing protein [Streptomyces sp. NPDC050738]|uniref:DUF4386 domain-containing protein n=1 Tax=Streptomyces sp. NPDC050738 TaxID=3154744 RepID=UPI00341F86CD
MTTFTSPRAAAAAQTQAQAQQRGLSPRLAVAGYALATIAYVVANRSTPRPDAPGSEVLEYAQQHGTAVNAGSVLLALSGVLVVAVAAAFRTRLRAAGAGIALSGGVLAGIALITSAVFGLLGGRLAADASPAHARDLADLAFWSGGAAFAGSFALLAIGVSLAARRTGALPGAMRVIGLVLGAAGVVSVLSVVIDPLAYALPLVRFGGLLWLVCAAVLLRRRA